ncbi:MAG TPA: FIST N-terminal domain-containing protein [Polyangiaceae bacterium]|nr:FIST N-terminal domain-containing protein [Polyangiaceae bacterium]
MASMKVHRGRSFNIDAREAVREITRSWKNAKPNMIFAFASTKQDAAAVADELAACFPGVPMAGCTTSGEQLDGEHSNGSLVVAALEADGIHWETALVGQLEEPEIRSAANDLFRRLGVDRESFDPKHYFAITFIDGLSLREEGYIATLADALEGIPVLGGSAGDDLAFERTLVIEGGRARSGAAVIVLAHAPNGYDILKHQHFRHTATTLAVTRVNLTERRVLEFDGIVAAEAFARAIGTTREELSTDATISKPVLLCVNGEPYIRAIRSIEEDGSLVFYCAVEEGMVLRVGAHEDMLEAMADHFGRERPAHRADFLLSCNCILRALEAGSKGLHEGLGRNLQSLADSSIGFDTYGEQLNGLHINQTVVALALRGTA